MTAFVGLAISTAYGNGVSMTADRMNMSDSYMWIFSFAGQLLTMLNPVLCSYLMEINMENFVYMAIATTVLGLLSIPSMTFIFESIRSKGNLKVTYYRIHVDYQPHTI